MGYRQHGEIYSWQLASGFFSECLQMQSTLYASAVRKLPGWKVLNPRLHAGVIFCSLPLRAALNVVNILEGESEKVFLIGTMRAPPGPIHLGAAFGHALCEAIQCADRLAVVSEIINCPCDDHERDKNSQPFQSRWCLGAWYFFVRARHCEFLYHDIKGPGQHV